MNCLKKVSLKPPGGRDSAPPARIPLRVSQGSTCIQSLPSTQSAVVPRAHYHAIASAALALALVCSPAAMAVDENAQGAFSMKCAGNCVAECPGICVLQIYPLPAYQE